VYFLTTTFSPAASAGRVSSGPEEYCLHEVVCRIGKQVSRHGLHVHACGPACNGDGVESRDLSAREPNRRWAASLVLVAMMNTLLTECNQIATRNRLIRQSTQDLALETDSTWGSTWRWSRHL